MATSVLDSGVRGPAVALVLALGLSCGGCAAGTGATKVLPATAPAHEGNVVMSSVPPAMLEAALDDAAQRTSVARADLRVVTAEAVTWPDGALGCPQPGMLYTQALVPGYRIVVQAGGEPLSYHAARTGLPRFCPAGHAQPPAEVGDGAA